MAESMKAATTPGRKSAAKAKTTSRAEKIVPTVEIAAQGETAKKKTAAQKPRTKAAPAKAKGGKGAAVCIPHEEIARLAHQYWIESGRQHGHHVDDWLRAEHTLLSNAA